MAYQRKKTDKEKKVVSMGSPQRMPKSYSSSREQLIPVLDAKAVSRRQNIRYKPVEKDGKDSNKYDKKIISKSSQASVHLGNRSVKIKPKNMSAVISPKNCEVRPIIPAKKKELISVAKAMHREEFAPRLQNLFQSETNAALEAIHSGVYIGWRCPEYSWDCIRLSKHSRCFCDHNLNEHSSFNAKSIKVKCLHANCNCKAFEFIPERPQDIGEFWLPKRPGFDVTLWRAKCRCKHTHVQHEPNRKKCTVRGCSCFIFESAFLCAACDRHWEVHETIFDNVDSRKIKGLPYAEEYLPFHEMPDLRNVCLTGRESDDDLYLSITSGPNAVPRFNPSKLSLELADNPKCTSNRMTLSYKTGRK